MRPAGAAGAAFVCGETGPRERPAFLPHAAPRSESHADALDDRRRACVRACMRRCGLEGGPHAG